VLEDFDRIVGLDWLKCIHLNDSKTPLGSFRDRHENLGEGEIGREGCAAFLSEPAFECLPVVMEVPGTPSGGPQKVDVDTAFELRAEGLAARG